MDPLMPRVPMGGKRLFPSVSPLAVSRVSMASAPATLIAIATLFLTAQVSPAPRAEEVKSAPAAATAAPKPASLDPSVTSIYKLGKLQTIVAGLSAQANIPIHLLGATPDKRCDLLLRDVPLSTALNTLRDEHDLIWWREPDGSISIADAPFFRETLLRRGSFEEALALLARSREGFSYKRQGEAYLIKDPSVPPQEPETDAPTAPEGERSPSLGQAGATPVNLQFRQAKLEQILYSIQLQTGLHFVARGAARTIRVDFQAQKMPLQKALDQLCVASRLSIWREADGRYAVSDRAYHRWYKSTMGGLKDLLDAACVPHGYTWKQLNSGDFLAERPRPGEATPTPLPPPPPAPSSTQ